MALAGVIRPSGRLLIDRDDLVEWLESTAKAASVGSWLAAARRGDMMETAIRRRLNIQ